MLFSQGTYRHNGVCIVLESSTSYVSIETQYSDEASTKVGPDEL